ncbi:MAG: replication-associated recombination protein A [Epsilonproteobacteria bacterium]|nr:replication-associated recombination protein A [Campylobacterota bacterium]
MDFAHLLRPQNLQEFVGQTHLLSPQSPFRILVEKEALSHSFFYGPAGVGKTSLARVIAKEMDRDFYEFNATSLKIEDLRKIFKQYQNALVKPLVFIDEVHRLSKNQQEVLLPVMEKNEALILGASTSNPYYSLTSAIRSRSMLFELKPLSDDELEQLLQKAKEKTDFSIDDDAKNYLIKSSGGDARAMLKLLESVLHVNSHITLETVRSLRPNALNRGSSEADVHYDLISALIKSIRGSDLDASIYYLARLIEGGESADFIARRLVILASEDIGLANPNALNLATSTLTAVSSIGFPEARIILSECVLYLASSPKSNTAYKAINAAQKAIKEGLLMDIPKNIVHDKENYLYPHDFGGYIKQQYLEKEISFVKLKENGYEKKIKEWYNKLLYHNKGFL